MRPSVNSRLIPVISDVHNFPFPHTTVYWSILPPLPFARRPLHLVSFLSFLFSYLLRCVYILWKKLVSLSTFLFVSLLFFFLFSSSSPPPPHSLPFSKLYNSQDSIIGLPELDSADSLPFPALGIETDSLLRLQQGPSIESR